MLSCLTANLWWCFEDVINSSIRVGQLIFTVKVSSFEKIKKYSSNLKISTLSPNSDSSPKNLISLNFLPYSKKSLKTRKVVNLIINPIAKWTLIQTVVH